jgi:hypothetical protein
MKAAASSLLSSLAARGAVGTLSAYAATKGAVDTLVKHFAYVLGGRSGAGCVLVVRFRNWASK